MGGAAMVYAGVIISNKQSKNDNTGEVSQMVELQWFGATQYFSVPLNHELVQVAEGATVLLVQKQKKSKNGFYGDRDSGLQLLSIGGKPVARSEAA